MQYIGTKLCFTTRVPTDEELASCPHIEMTSRSHWEPSSVQFGAVQTVNATQRHILGVQTSSTFISNNPYCNTKWPSHAYTDPTLDEAILHDIEPSIISAKERMINAMSRQHTNDEDDVPEHVPARRSFVDSSRHRQVSAHALSEVWNIGLKKASATLKATTQYMIRSAILPLGRRYRADRMYNVKRLQGKFATDTFFSPGVSLLGNTCAQIYSHKNGFSICYPLPRANGESIGQTLNDFIHDYGAPHHLTFDGAQVQVGRHTKFQQLLRRHNISSHISSPRRPNENPGESAICEVKR